MSVLRWTYTPPPLPVQLIHQEKPGLETYDCTGCNGTGQTYRSRFASRTAACDECAGQGVLSIPAQDFDKCRGCGARSNSLTWNGLCGGCNLGHEYDPHDESDPVAQCRECGYDQEELTWGGLCRYCSEKEDRA